MKVTCVIKGSDIHVICEPETTDRLEIRAHRSDGRLCDIAETISSLVRDYVNTRRVYECPQPSMNAPICGEMPKVNGLGAPPPGPRDYAEDAVRPAGFHGIGADVADRHSATAPLI